MKITRNGADYRLESRLWLPRPVDEIWPFFADPANLEQITPPFLSFRIEDPQSIEMGAGALIDYHLKVHGLPLRWRTEIVEWNPPHGFVDLQLRGPYRRWHHRHTFVAKGSGTDCIDVVDYRLPFGPLGRLAHALFVRRDVQSIFEHRAQALIRLFGRQSPPPLLARRGPSADPLPG